MLDEGLIPDDEPPKSPNPRQSFGDYELLEEIARGGMGVVYKARQRSLNRIVAVKMILSGQFAGVTELARFRAEAETAASLKHPNIVRIHEVGEHEGQAYFAMDYIEGQNLAEVVGNTPISAARAANYLLSIAEAVHYAHSKGVLHRDLKPSNILVDDRDQPHVADFGLAKTREREASLTLTGQVLGSPSFMSPEQASGKGEDIAAASDVYSLGAILYHLLTGRPPFAAPTLTQTLRLLAETEAVPPRLLNPGVPRDLETICLKCLDKEPRRRYASTKSLLQDLQHFLRDEPILARPVSPIERTWRWCRRHPPLATLSGAVLALLLAVAMGSILYASRLKVANQRGTDKLWEAYLGQAQAGRYSGQAGRRGRSLELIQKAAQIRPSPDLRSEAIACLALEDIHPVTLTKIVGGRGRAFDRTFSRSGSIEGSDWVIRSVPDEKELNRFHGLGTVSWSAFSPDSRFALVVSGGSSTEGFQVFDLENHQPIITYSNGWIRDCRFTADGNELFLALGDPSQITKYSLPAGQEQKLITLPWLIYGLSVNRTGDQLAISSDRNNEIQILDAATGERVGLPLVHPEFVSSMDWSPDGRFLAAGCHDGNIYIWDVANHRKQSVLTGHNSLVGGLWFSNDGNRLASRSWDNTFHLWNASTGRQLLTRPCYGSLNPFSPDDRWIMIPTADAQEICNRTGDREWRGLYPETAAQNTGGQDCEWIANGRLLVTRHKDGLRFWDPSKGRELSLGLEQPRNLVDLAFDPANLILTAATRFGLCSWQTHWEKSKEGQQWRWEPLRRFPDIIAYKLSLNKTGDILAASVGSEIQIFEWPSGKKKQTFRLENGVYGWALSPGGRFCLGWPERGPGLRKVWDVATGSVVKNFPSASFYGAAFTPDDRVLVVGSPTEYEAWDTASWTNIWKLPRQDSGGAHARIAFTTDGKMGALSLSAQSIRLFEPLTGREVATLIAPEPQTLSWLAFSSDGTHLAATTQTRAVHLWDLGLLRKELAAMNLDWDAPPLPSEEHSAGGTITIVPPFTNSLWEYHTPAAGIPKRDSACSSNQVDLSLFYNASLLESWYDPRRYAGNDLAALPRGFQTFDGVKFDVRGMIQLAGDNASVVVPYPRQVEDIPINIACRTLHFLHATGWSSGYGWTVGEYVIRYADNVETHVPLKFAENTSCWWDIPGQTVRMKPGTTLAWRGRNPYSERQRTDILLFHFRFENPRPEVAIESLSFRSAMTECVPFLVAITAE